MKPLVSSIQLQWEYNINIIKYTFSFNVFIVHCDNCEWRITAIIYHCHNTVNTSITGLLPNTTYTCCVLAVTSYRQSEPVCKNITTANDESKFYDIIKYLGFSLSHTDSDCTCNTSSLTITISWIDCLFVCMVICIVIW